MLAGYNLEAGMLPSPFMHSPSGGTNAGDLNGTGRGGGLDTSSNMDSSDRKRSVSFAPASSAEEDLNRISIGRICRSHV